MASNIIKPSYHQGFARSTGESKYPELWRGFKGAWAPFLGVTGGKLHNQAKFDSAYFDDIAVTTSWGIGKDGRALTFDGTNDWVKLRLWDNPSGIFTFHARVKFEEAIGSYEQITAADSNVRAWQWRRSNAGKLQFIVFVGGSPITITGNTTLTTGEWWDVFAINDGVKAYIYVNGVSDKTPVSTGAVDNNAARWGIGARNSSGSWGVLAEILQGKIEFLNYWDRAVNPSEIKSLIQRPYAPFELADIPIGFVAGAPPVGVRPQGPLGHPLMGVFGGPI